MNKSELIQIIKEEFIKLLKEEQHNIGDTIELVTVEFPGYKFPYGTKGKVVNIDKADYASDDLVYTIKLRHIDPTGDVVDELLVDNPKMIK